MKDSNTLFFAWQLTMLFKVVATVGLVLFVVWATKLKQNDLKKWVIWLLVVGLLGTLLTSAAFGTHKYKKFDKKGKASVEDVTDNEGN